MHLSCMLNIMKEYFLHTNISYEKADWFMRAIGSFSNGVNIFSSI